MSNKKIEIGVVICQYYGEMDRLRKVWMEADELGTDRIFVADHFFPQIVTEEVLSGREGPKPDFDGNMFEATTLQAAMAATTSHATIGCMVHAIGYRNPNLLADMARTMSHVSNGRFMLGLGAGYFEPDYVEYGYEYGTAKSRASDLKQGILTIRDRFQKLVPQPLGEIPIMVGSMGGLIGMNTAAELADSWHIFGEKEYLEDKIGVMHELLDKVGRDRSELEFSSHYLPDVDKNTHPDNLLKMGVTNINVNVVAPDFDLGLLREVIAWRDNLDR